MKEKFLKHIEENKLFLKEDKILIGVSGGADSVALLTLLHSLNYNICFAHCNFNLRGKESDEDELFVKRLSEIFNIECYIKSFDVKSFSKKNKISTQMAARELRYKWFEEIRKLTNSKYIAVAHHQDDDIETFFINLIRGTGIRGFLGMKSKKNSIVRPLLEFSRKDIEFYLKGVNQEYRIDSSNTDVKYLRNNIRHHLLPLLKDMNPSFDKTVINEIEYLNDVFTVYNNKIESLKKDLIEIDKDQIIIKKNKLLSKDNYKILLREILFPFGFKQTDKIIDSFESVSGKTFFSDHYRLLIDREEIIIVKKNNDVSDEILLNQETTVLDSHVKLKLSLSDQVKFDSDPKIAVLDYNTLSFPLTIRKWRDGDFFYPLGMKGRKKLSNFFIDNKFSLLEKENCWLLCSNDNIVWVIGSRIDERFKVSNNTKKAYIAELF